MNWQFFLKNRISAPTFAVFLTLFLISVNAFSTEEFTEKISPLASEYAERGGVLVLNGYQYPKSLNGYLENYVITSRIFGMMFDSLVEVDDYDLVFRPALAKTWHISADGLVFTFELDERAIWSDGKPILASDILWTFEQIRDPKNLTGGWLLTLDRIERVEQVGERVVKFYAKEAHWRNFLACANISPLPKHIWQGRDFTKINFKFPVVSGMYEIAELAEQRFLRMHRREKYWAANLPRNEFVFNFDELHFRFYASDDVAFEAFQKGELDIYSVNKAQRWEQEALGQKYERNWILKQKIYNQEARGFQGFAMNLRRDLFKDKRVRLALAHALDRRRLIASLMFGAYKPTTSYFPDLWTAENECPNKVVEYDLERARELLAEAGWSVDKKAGFLSKDGKKFEFDFLTRSADSNRFLLIYKDALVELGIKMRIVQKDLAAWAKDMDVFNFDMTWAAWSASIFKDPQTMWHSKSKDVERGSNITGFANAKVDTLIDTMRLENDINKRNDIIRKIDSMLFAEAPYVLLWDLDYKRLLSWNKFARPEHVLGKIGDDYAAVKYWWHDLDQETALQDAMANNEPMPDYPKEVHYKEEK